MMEPNPSKTMYDWLENLLKEPQPGFGIHEDIRDYLGKWAKGFFQLVDEAIASNFYDKATQTQLKDYARAFLTRLNLIIAGNVTPDWPYLFFLLVAINYYLAAYFLKPPHPPKGADPREVALYFLHPACPIKTEIELVDSYDIPKSTLNDHINKMREKMKTKGWIGIAREYIDSK